MNGINYFKLFLALFLALLLSNLSLRLIDHAWVQYQAKVAMEQLQKQQARQRAESAAQQQKQQQQVALRSSIRQTNQEICDYWRQVYEREASAKHQRFRDNACQRAATD